MRVLVIEDEQNLRDQLALKLRESGYVVDTADDGETGLYYAREYPIDVAIVDIGLPVMSGVDVIKTLRSEGHSYPVLILTARSRWQEKVEGLEAGADDYMVKPFHIEELLARLRALVRRAAGVADSVVRCGEIEMDTHSQAVSVSGKQLDLTAYEYRLLQYLMLNTGKVISKSELTEHIYEEDAERDSNVIEVFIGRLRRKLDPENLIQPIETLRGRGYRFNIPFS